MLLRPVHFSSGILGLQRLSLIVELLALGEANLELCETFVVDEKDEGDDCETALLGFSL